MTCSSLSRVSILDVASVSGHFPSTISTSSKVSTVFWSGRDLIIYFTDFASLLRLPAGILVADEHIHSVRLRSLLSSVLDYDRTTLARLFDNKDHQNVPNAVSLLNAVKSLSQDSKFASALENRAVVLLGHFIGFFLDPFTIPSLSLSDQLTSLASAAHMLFLLYRRNRTSFCPGQWYYDIQSLIKSVYFTVAKQKLLDPTAEYHLTSDGTDRLENNFGIYRDIGGPGSNVDILQLCHRAGLAAGIAQIYSKHPEWDRGHKRLRLAGVDGVDHTNPHSWIGDVRAGSVSLLTSWKNGWRTVRKLFDSLGVPLENIEELDDSIDLLRPFSQFVGLTDKDFDYGNSAATATSASNEPTSSDASDTTSEAESHAYDAHIDLEDVLPAAGNDDIEGVRRDDRFWLKIQGKAVHKASAVRCFLGKSVDGGRKSTDRTQRVQGVLKVRTYSREPPSPSLDDDSIIGPQFLLGDFVATFLRVKDSACVAILRISEIRDEAKVSLPSIATSSLSSPEVMLRGQVLRIKSAGNANTWIWDGEYESFNSSSDGSLASRSASKKSTLLDIHACLCKPFKARIDRIQRHNSTLQHPSPGTTLSPSDSQNCEDGGSVVEFRRVFDAASIEALADVMWDQIKQYQSLILSCEATGSYPPRSTDGECDMSTLCSPSSDQTLQGEYLFTNTAGSALFEAGPKDGHGKCYVCDSEVPIKKMRDHVARHILSARLDMPEDGKRLVTVQGAFIHHPRA